MNFSKFVYTEDPQSIYDYCVKQQSLQPKVLLHPGFTLASQAFKNLTSYNSLTSCYDLLKDGNMSKVSNERFLELWRNILGVLLNRNNSKQTYASGWPPSEISEWGAYLELLRAEHMEVVLSSPKAPNRSSQSYLRMQEDYPFIHEILMDPNKTPKDVRMAALLIFSRGLDAKYSTLIPFSQSLYDASHENRPELSSGHEP